MFNHLTLKWKLLSFPILTGFILVLIAVLGQLLAAKNSMLIENIVERSIPTWEDSRNVNDSMFGIRQVLSAAEKERSRDKIAIAESYRDNLLASIESIVENDVSQRDDFARIKKSFSDYFEAAKGVVLQVIENGNTTGLESRITDVENRFTVLQDQVNEYIAGLKVNMHDQMETSVKGNNTMMLVLSVIIAVFLVGYSAFSLFLLNNLRNPLKLMVTAAEKVSAGDMTVTVPEYPVKDEIGTLMEQFGKMVQVLQNLTAEIKKSANGIAVAAGQISASVSQISTAATETASAASETSTTVEEVRMTALDSNRKAKNVSASAQQSVEISLAGEKTVQDTITGMHKIEEQMESIADSIMKLSEHGQAIGDIIAVVEDVAEQSRLLAVNASIEAVKAGEQGKGFSVVAAEVQSLAEQSKAATEHVRSILADIQKATSEAVMKTEQGTRAVESGVTLSGRSGDAIKKLAESVDDASQATTQISVSSQEQLVGMDQVVQAMESIKTASAQNVMATKQVESAAQDLYKLGQRLSEFMEQYKLN
ncbi:methyl-accepting chemotaxis protein [bacterium]|nr:methyl-accepting chemotaxis protein [bacterium]